MKQDDTLHKGQTDEYPRRAIVVDEAFEYTFALYRSRVYEYVHSLLMGDFPDENKEDNAETC
jgi:hypothetical protein